QSEIADMSAVAGAAKLNKLSYDTTRTAVDVSGYTGNPIAVEFQDTDITAGTVVAAGSKDKLSYASDTYILEDGTGDNAGKVVLAAKTVEKPWAALSQVKFALKDGNTVGYKIDDNGVLSDDEGNSVYGYKATLTGVEGVTYTTVKAYLKATDGAEGNKTFDRATLTGPGSFDFYVVVNKALDTEVSKVYCE
ncbi:MAG: hypothetical protein ACI4DP_13820, partial [Candidatus Ornithomonoglobus sp.]